MRRKRLFVDFQFAIFGEYTVHHAVLFVDELVLERVCRAMRVAIPLVQPSVFPAGYTLASVPSAVIFGYPDQFSCVDLHHDGHLGI